MQKWMIPPWRRLRPLHALQSETLGPNRESSLFGCGWTPGGGQQGPGSLVGNQIFHQCCNRGRQVSRRWDGPPCQNEVWMTTEAIKEAKAHCALHHQGGGDLLDGPNKWCQGLAHATHIKEIEDNCALASTEAENCCLSAIQRCRILRCFQMAYSIQQYTCQRTSSMSRGRGHQGGEAGTALLSLPPVVLPSGPTLLRPMA